MKKNVFNSDYHAIKIEKKIPFIYFEKDLGYIPFTFINCKKIKGNEDIPLFGVPLGGASHDGFFLYHSKVKNINNFKFFYCIIDMDNKQSKMIEAKLTYKKKYKIPRIPFINFNIFLR